MTQHQTSGHEYTNRHATCMNPGFCTNQTLQGKCSRATIKCGWQNFNPQARSRKRCTRLSPTTFWKHRPRFEAEVPYNELKKEEKP